MPPTKISLLGIIARVFAGIAMLVATLRAEAEVPPASWATFLTGTLNGVTSPKILANPVGGFYVYSGGDRPLIKFNNDGSIAWEVKLQPGVNDVREVVQLDILENGDLIAIVAAGVNAHVFGQQFVSDGRWLVRLRSADASPVFVKDLGNCWLTAIRARPGGGYFVAGFDWDVARIGGDQLPIATNQLFLAQFTTAFDWAATGEWTGFFDDIESIRTSGSGTAVQVWAVGNLSRASSFGGKTLAQAGAYLAILDSTGQVKSASVLAPAAAFAAFELRPGGGAHLATKLQTGSDEIRRLNSSGVEIWRVPVAADIAAMSASDEVYAMGTARDNAFTIAFDNSGNEKWRRNVTTRSIYTGSGIALLSDGRLTVSGTTAPSGIWIDDFFLRDFASIENTSICGYIAALETRPSAVPVFRVQPRDQKLAISGETVTLHTQIYSPSGVALEWYKDGSVIPGQTSADLVLPNVQASDSGKYFLEAQNAAGLSRSAEVEIIVNNVSVTTLAGTDSAGALDSPRSPITLPDGSILVADPPKNVIRRINSSGVTTFAGTGEAGLANGAPADAMFSSPSGLALETRYYGPIVYVADRGNNLLRRIHFATDSGDAISVDQMPSNQLDAPANLAILNGLPWIVAATYSSTGLWRITETSTAAIAGSVASGAVAGMAFDDRGNLYLSDSLLNEIRMKSPDDQVTTIVSNLNGPAGMALDESGNIYVAERGGHTIRKVSPAGSKTLVAGLGLSGFQNGSGIAAAFNAPQGISFRNGSLIVADTGNHCLRELQFTPASRSGAADAQIRITLGGSLAISVSAATGNFAIESSAALGLSAQWTLEGTVGANSPPISLQRPLGSRFYRARQTP